MFNLLGVTVLQPEHVISARLPGGAEAIGTLLTTIQELLRSRYDDTTVSGSRTLCIAVGPERRLQLWLAAPEDTPTSDEQTLLRELARHVSAPEVHEGPIALALVFAIGVEPPAEAQLALPDEWRAVVQASDTTLNVDQIITRLWASN
jgi:hypothetical protein